MPPLSRRRLLQLGSTLPLWMPRLARAGGSTAGERKFLYLFANGGWDPTWGIAPMYGTSTIDSNLEAEPANVGGLDFVDGPQAPHVRSFFEAHADRTCLVHGFEVRSITHERCKRLIMTGKSASTADDWPSQVAGNSGDYLVPHVVISGPSFTSQYTSSVVRLGETGQFAALLDGTALTGATPRRTPLSGTAASAVARFRESRASAFAASAGRGRPELVASALVGANERLDLLTSIDDLDLSGGEAGAGGIIPLLPALDALERGYARSAILSHGGLFDVGWDSHSGIEQQTFNYEVLFADLMSLMEELDQRPGQAGGSLAEETTVVVISEMGRAPSINATGGKDHWTFTSAMFIGAGVAGGRQIGGYDEHLLGKPVDPATGELSEKGVILGTEHIGATILALADVDPESAPIAAVLA